MRQKGFTLIEILVALAVVITSATIVVAVITTSLRGSNKATIAESVRQEGNIAMSQISRTIQFAESFEGVKRNQSDSYSATCPSGGDDYNFVRVRYGGSNVEISCNNLSLDGNPLIDTNDVSVSRCSFVCSQSSSIQPPFIEITFTLTERNSGRAEQQASIPFSKGVRMRNLNQ
jgi:type II secretory pathway pseudopilin PulG